jgi:hypothetical protein
VDTNLTTTVDADLIDHGIIARAAERHGATAARLAKAASDRAKAQAALETAHDVSERAVGGDGDALEAQIRLEAAARLLDVAARVHERAELEHRRATADHETAQALALKPVWAADVRRRLALAREGDALDAKKAAVMREYAAVTEHMRELAVLGPVGLPDLHGSLGDGTVVFRTEQEERKHWQDRQVDPDDPRHPWEPGMAQ